MTGADLATLIAAAVAAVASLFSAVVSAYGARSAERQKWLREERKPAYSRFLAATRAVRDAAWAAHLTYTASGHDPERETEEAEAFAAAYEQLGKARAELDIIGSERVLEKAMHVASGAFLLGPWVRSYSRRQSPDDEFGYERDLRMLDEAAQQFLAEVRGELRTT